jgi:adenine phosphoribosyltransferase
MKPYLKLIDTETPGYRNDVTPLFADAGCFGQLVDDLVVPFKDTQIDYVAGIDALGFILGTAVALKLGIGIVPIRKGGKLPVPVDTEEFQDYTGDIKQLEMRKDALPPNAHVLLVDEWIETGAQIMAAAKLVEAQGGTIVGIASINMDVKDQTNEISKKYRVHTVWEDE